MRMSLRLAFVALFFLSVNSAPPLRAQQPAAVHVALGSIGGTVKDVTGAAVPGAHITLTRTGTPGTRDTTSGSDGDFSFTAVAPGAFSLSIREEGLEPDTFTGVLAPGESFTVPSIALRIATANSSVSVSVTSFEIAEAEIKQEEHQRVFGIVPNFFVVYVSNPAPLKASQKFKLSGKVIFDPTTFLFAGVAAGIEQATNTFPGYGPGWQGYGQRYGATLANSTTATLLRGAVLPSLFHQDPRYFYKGTGTVRSRVLYALSTAFICKGDNGRWQPNYSDFGGNLAAGAISNLYYPAGSRNGVALTFENAAIGIAGTAAGHVVQEFLYRRLTPHVPRPEPSGATSPPPLPPKP